MEPVSRLSRPLSQAIMVLFGILLVDVLFEGWLVTILGGSTVDKWGMAQSVPAEWPKAVKSGLYLALFALTAIKFTVDRTWHTLRTKADMALLALGLIMVVAGLVGGSSAVLIGQALFVYFRGVIVFYAWRAAQPTWREVKPLLWIAGGFMVISSLLAVWQFFGGRPAYAALGWIDMRWARENRAEGLLEHPNDLGHLSGLMLLGLLAWFAVKEKVGARWWILFGFIAFALGVSQSRQSTLAVLAGVLVIAWLRRARIKRVIAATLVILALSALPVLLSPESRSQLAYRFGGLFNAFGMSDVRDECFDNPAPECADDGEVRVLFIRQGLRLWLASPVLGYGAGQFGGIVAVKHDAKWNEDPRFKEVLGPDGFFLHDFKSTSVDVFWLHLLVEVGALGLLAYLAWMYFLTAPLIRPARGSPGPIPLWAVATVVYAMVIAAWSPSLEDPLFPPLMFAVIGFGWVVLRGAPSRQELPQ